MSTRASRPFLTRNRSRSRVERSARCASSTMRISGATRANRLSNVASRPNSPARSASPGDAPDRPSRSAICAGLSSSASWRTTAVNGAYGRPPPLVSGQPPQSISTPSGPADRRAFAANSRIRRDLPEPASPPTRTVTQAASLYSNAVASMVSSASRPAKTGLTMPAVALSSMSVAAGVPPAVLAVAVLATASRAPRRLPSCGDGTAPQPPALLVGSAGAGGTASLPCAIVSVRGSHPLLDLLRSNSADDFGMHGVLPDQWLTCFSRYIEIRAKAGGLASGGFLISADLAPRPRAKPCSAHLRHLRPAKTLEVHDLRGGPRLPRGRNLARVALGFPGGPSGDPRLFR